MMDKGMSETRASRAVKLTSPTGRSVAFGNDLPAAFLLGPCALESRAHAIMMATALRDMADRLGVGVVYKTSFDKANRTSVEGQRGIGLEAAKEVFTKIRGEIGLPVITDVHLPEQCDEISPFVDILQIPAFLCRQTDLLQAAAETGRPVNVKKGQFMAPWDMRHVVDKLDQFGASGIMLTERGTSFGYNTLVSDMRGLPQMAEHGVPVIFDATHSVQQPGGMGARSGGQRAFAPVLARAAAAVGVAGIFMECHNEPDNAPSDGANMIRLDELEDVLHSLVAFDHLQKKITVSSL